MQNLLRGVREFRTQVFESQRPLFEELARGQRPDTLFITCSDSRVDPNLLTQSKPGELFILRIVGNIVPPHGAGPSSEAATIEYAVANLKVRDIVICGHSHCGAVKGMLQPESLGGLPAVAAFLARSGTAADLLDDEQGRFTGQSPLDVAVKQNVLAQLANLRTHPSVAEAVARGDLQLHGWVYVIETGEVLGYDEASGRFQPVDADEVLDE